MEVYKDKIFKSFEFEGKNECCYIAFNGISLSNIESVDIHIDVEHIVLKLVQDGRENTLVTARTMSRGNDNFSIKIK